jgi:transposase
VISAVANRGELYFMVFQQRFRDKIFIRFLWRLLRQAGGKVFLIVDGHPVHRAQSVKNWVARHRAQIELVELPGYSPELNPDELLNQDVKSNALGRKRPHNAKELTQGVRRYLRRRQRQPEVVRRYFEEEHVRYASI